MVKHRDMEQKGVDKGWARNIPSGCEFPSNVLQIHSSHCSSLAFLGTMSNVGLDSVPFVIPTIGGLSKMERTRRAPVTCTSRSKGIENQFTSIVGRVKGFLD